MLSAEDRNGAEMKIGERPVLILGVKSEPCGRWKTEKRAKIKMCERPVLLLGLESSRRQCVRSTS